jgi:hypothetical protein
MILFSRRCIFLHLSNLLLLEVFCCVVLFLCCCSSMLHACCWGWGWFELKFNSFGSWVNELIIKSSFELFLSWFDSFTTQSSSNFVGDIFSRDFRRWLLLGHYLGAIHFSLIVVFSWNHCSCIVSLFTPILERNIL